METLHKEALGALERTFGDRLRRCPVRNRGPSAEDILATVLPVSAEEVELLAKVAERYSVMLVALGAGTTPGQETGPEKGSILVRFDLMRRTRLPDDPGEPWVWAEPGAPWLELDNNLSLRGRGLTVYPTSAPRATVGGWLALDGIGVGSFEYGWSRENVLSADMVLSGGERREVAGDELGIFLAPGGTRGVVVGAKLRTRQADRDVPFAATFGDAEDLIGAVAGVIEAQLPLWHMAVLNPVLTRARHLGEAYLLFGAYPGERGERVEKGLQSVLEHHRGDILPAAGAYRVWGQRFFPIAPSHPSPDATREFACVAGLLEALAGTADRAVQGTVARSGKVLLLTFKEGEGGLA